MKVSFFKLSCLTGIATVAFATGLHAGTLTWDADTNTPAAQDGAGTWDVSTNFWFDGANDVIWDNVTPANAIFGAGTGTAGTVSNTVPINVGNLTFNATGGGTYTLAATTANPITLVGTPQITANVSAAINVVLTGTSFSKEGPGQISLRPGAANTYSGVTTVDNGILALNSSTSSRVLIPGDLIINNGGTVTNIGTAGPIATTSTVTVNSGGTYHGGSGTINALVLAGGTVYQNTTELITLTSLDARSGSILQSSGATGKLDAGTFTKSTAGTVTLTSKGSSATTGGLTTTIVNAGTLILDYTQASSKLIDSGSLTVNGGILSLINGPATEAVGSVVLAGGVITNTGTSKLSTSGSYDVRAGSCYTVLSGTGSLTKSTADTTILAATNTYTGGTTISAGVLQLGDGVTNGTVANNILNNASLIFNPGAVPGSYSGIISGSGSVTKNGSGTQGITGANSYQGSTILNSGILTLNSSATLGDGTGTLTLSGGTLSTTASRTPSSAPILNALSIMADSAITTVSASSTVDFNLSNNSIGGSAGSLTFSNSAASGTGVFQPRLSGSGFTFALPIVIANGSFGTTRLDSYNTTGTTQTFTGVISGNGGYRHNASVSGTGGTTILGATNTYTGNTDVNQGNLVVNGAIGTSTVTVAANGTLGGTGAINGPVTVSGTLAEGASIGTLTINNTLTFQASGTNISQLNKTLGTNDLYRGITTLTYGGTLVVNNLSGTLTNNDTFKIFDATTYAGSFANTNLPALDPSLAWDLSGLASNGTIKVVPAAAANQPTLGYTPSGNTITFNWTGSFKLQAETNSLAVGLNTNWADYPSGGSSPVTVTNDPNNPTVFFRLSTP